jgi:autotransporter-associated beta strand protein
VVADGGNRTLANPITITGNATFGESLDGTPHSLAFTGAGKLNTSVTLTAANSAGAALGSLDLGANTFTVAGNGNLNVAGSIIGTGKVVKNGGGTLTLDGNGSNFSGGLTVNSGSVTAKSGTSVGTGTVALFNGASLSFTDPAATITQTFQLNTNTLFPPAGGQLTYNGASVFVGALGAGQHVFANGTQLETVRAVSGAVLSQSGGTVTFDNVLMTGTSSFTQAAGSTLNTTGDFTANPATTFTLNGTANTHGASFSGAVAIHGGATLANSGDDLFLVGSQGASVSAGGTLSTTAGTAIELGTTLLNDGTQTGTLHVNSGGALKGNGSFGDTTLGAGALLSPGNPPGTATFSNLTLESGAEIRFEFNDIHATPGNGADFLAIGGLLDLSAGSSTAGAFTLSLVSLTSGGQPGALPGFNPLVPFSLTFATAAGGISGFGPNEFIIDLGDFTNNLAGGSFSVAEQGNSLLLNFTPVPEPSAFLPFSLGAVLLLGARNRRRICGTGVVTS